MSNRIRKAEAELTEMELSDRITAIAEDVKSRADKYAGIDSIQLAELLGIDEGNCPGSGSAQWAFFRYTERSSINDFLADWDSIWTYPVIDALEKVVTKERLSEIERILESHESYTRGFDESQLSEKEREILLGVLLEEELEGGGPNFTIARSCVSTKSGFELIFEGFIEDDGVCLGLLTPYDHRDGRFVDLDNTVYEEW
jgi:hypothetical protein